MKSAQAQVASQIRKSLKAAGIQCKVKSRSFAGGNSVDVEVFDQLPATMAILEAEFAQYQYGHFDGMTDSYEYSNSRDDIPQTRFLHIANVYSKDIRQAAWNWTRANYSDFANSPADVAEAYLYDDSMALNQTLNQAKGGFWATLKPRVAA